MMRVDERLDRTRRATLSVYTSKLFMDCNRVGSDFLSRAVIPFADHFDHFEFFPRFIEHLMEAVMAVTVHRVARWTTHLKDLATVCFDFFQEPTSGQAAELDLINIDSNRVR